MLPFPTHFHGSAWDTWRRDHLTAQQVGAVPQPWPLEPAGLTGAPPLPGEAMLFAAVGSPQQSGALPGVLHGALSGMPGPVPAGQALFWPSGGLVPPPAPFGPAPAGASQVEDAPGDGADAAFAAYGYGVYGGLPSGLRPAEPPRGPQAPGPYEASPAPLPPPAPAGQPPAPPWTPAAETGAPPEVAGAESGAVQRIEAKPFRPVELAGISERTQAEHIKLYQGYVEKTNEIRRKLATLDLRATANANYSEYRALKVHETFNLNGVRLHELYFTLLGKAAHQSTAAGWSPARPTGKILSLIERDFGSFEAWVKDFKAAGLAGRGWAITAYDLDEGRLRNFSTDFHDLHIPWNAVALVAMDVFEHAYFIDWGTERARYIDAFLVNLDWDAVNRWVEARGLR